MTAVLGGPHSVSTLQRRHLTLQPGSVKAQAVPRQQLAEMLALVLARVGNVLYAVAQDTIPVPIIGTEAREILAYRAERFAQIRGRRVVRLETRVDLAAVEEVCRVVGELAVLEDVFVRIRLSVVALGALHQIVDAARVV